MKMLLGKLESFIFGAVCAVAVVEGFVIYVQAEIKAECRHKPFGYKAYKKKDNEDGVEPENKYHIGFI